MNKSNAISDKKLFLIIAVVFLITALFSATISYASNSSSDHDDHTETTRIQASAIAFSPVDVRVDAPIVPVSSPDMEEKYSDFPLKSRTSATEDELNGALEGTPMEGMAGAFLNAQERYGVNATALLALAIHESAWGRSGFARNRNNLFGFQAYTHNPGAARRFDTVDEGIDVVTDFIESQYLTEGGKHYRGGTLRDMNPIYSADASWMSKVALLWANLENGRYLD